MPEATIVTLVVGPGGVVESLETLDAAPMIAALGGATRRRRASHVVPAHAGPRLAFRVLRLLAGDDGRLAAWTRRWNCWWRVDLAPSRGPTLGPFPDRETAIAAELDWLDTHHWTRVTP